MRQLFLFLGLLVSAQFAVADIKCPIEKISAIQAMGDGSLYWINSTSQKRLAATGDNPLVLETYRALLIAAMQNGDDIQASFADGYDCSGTNKSSEAKWINLVKGRR